MNKRERIEHAIFHSEEMERLYRNDIMTSVKNSVVYDDSYHFKEGRSDSMIELVPEDTVTSLFNIDSDNVVILNFASYRHPGGGFLKGAMAQEESMCHESSLYCVLSRHPEYYKWNNKNLNNGLYLNRALMTPNIVFTKGDQIKRATVITCAAPNKRAALLQSVNVKENNEALASRIKFVSNIARDIGAEVFITGAYGCGAFDQDSNRVVKLFKEEAYGIKNMIFAVPKTNMHNYQAFHRETKIIRLASR